MDVPKFYLAQFHLYDWELYFSTKLMNNYLEKMHWFPLVTVSKIMILLLLKMHC